MNGVVEIDEDDWCINRFYDWISHRISDGFPFEKEGMPAGYVLRHKSEYGHLACWFDSESGTIAKMDILPFSLKNGYRIINPRFVLNAESNLFSNESVPPYSFIQLELLEDFLEKATAILNGEPFNSRILVPLDISVEDELELHRQAHSANMTTNDYVNMILKESIEVAERKKKQPD